MLRQSPQLTPRPQRNHRGNRQHRPSWQYPWWPLWPPQSAGVEIMWHQYLHQNHFALFQWFHTDPDAHEAILEDDPGQEEDEGLVAAVERWDVGGSQFLQGQQVQVVGQSPQDWKRCCSFYKKLESHPVLPKEPAALPEREKHHRRVTEVGSSFDASWNSVLLRFSLIKKI